VTFWVGRVAFLLAVLVLGLVLFNASVFAPTPQGTLKLIAHRGVAQQFPRRGVDNDTCTATRIEPPIHDRLENTARSIEDAINQGADVVEVDVAPTRDGRIALFHDWTVDCRTDGTGATRSLTLAELTALDPGHGYTADGGKSFPFRGMRNYPIPTLEEGLRASRNRPLMFNFKGKDPAEADLLAAALKAADRRVDDVGDSFYGHPAPVARIRTHFPKAWAWSKEGAKACTKEYMIMGWFGIMPEACTGGTIIVPLNYQWMVPGWPNRALARFKAAGTRVIVTGPRGDDAMAGLDLPEQLGDIPNSFKGYVWVEDIWTVGPALRPNRDIRTNAQLKAARAALEARRAARD
jgi:glycerophosphoryl diester phosphodiesterase